MITRGAHRQIRRQDMITRGADNQIRRQTGLDNKRSR